MDTNINFNFKTKATLCRLHNLLILEIFFITFFIISSIIFHYLSNYCYNYSYLIEILILILQAYFAYSFTLILDFAFTFIIFFDIILLSCYFFINYFLVFIYFWSGFCMWLMGVLLPRSVLSVTVAFLSVLVWSVVLDMDDLFGFVATSHSCLELNSPTLMLDSDLIALFGDFKHNLPTLHFHIDEYIL